MVKKLAYFCIALSLLWRLVRFLVEFPVWGDEAMVAVNFFDSSWSSLIQPLEYGQIAPLGWLWLERLMFYLGEGHMTFLRLPALIAGCLSVILFVRFAFRVMPLSAAYFAIAVFCASYYPMRHSVELKPYAFDLLFSLLLFISSYQLQFYRFIAFSFLGLFFSLPSIFVSLGCIFYLFLNNRELRKKLVLFGCALCGCFLVMYILFLSPHAASASWLKEMDMWKTSFPDLQNFWTIPLWLIERHAGYMSAYPTGGRNFGSLITFILQLIGVLVWYRSGRRKHLFLLWSSLPFLFSAAAIQAYPYGGSVRVAIFLAPAICISLGFALRFLFREKLGESSFLISMICFIILGIFRDIKEPYKNLADVRDVVFVEEVSAYPETERVVYGRLPGDINILNYGGSLARLRYLLRLKLDREIKWLAYDDAFFEDYSEPYIEYLGPGRGALLR